MELLRPTQISRLILRYKKPPVELGSVINWWQETPHVCIYDTESSLYESLTNIELKNVKQEKYAWLLYPAIFQQVDSPGFYGFWSSYDPGAKNLILVIDLKDQDELLKVSFSIDQKKNANALLREANIKRYRLKIEKNKLTKIVSLPAKADKKIIKQCLQLLTDVCEEPPEKVVAPEYIYKDMPLRKNQPEGTGYKDYTGVAFRRGGDLQPRLSNKIYRYSSEYYKELREAKERGEQRGRRRRGCWVRPQWRLYWVNQENEKGEIEKVLEYRRVPGHYINKKHFLANLNTGNQIPTIHKRR